MPKKDTKDLPDTKQIVQDTRDEKKVIAPAKTYRCGNCHRLLFKGILGDDGVVSCKCGKCGALNVFKVNEIPINFQDRMYRNRKHNKG